MSNRQAHLNEYRKQAVVGASPLQLVIMLYDGAIRHTEAGKRHMADGRLFEQNEELCRAQRIVAELIGCLDPDQGGEIAQNLLELYSFVYNGLIEANVHDDRELLEACLTTMRELRDGWSQVERTQREERPVEAGRVSDAA